MIERLFWCALAGAGIGLTARGLGWPPQAMFGAAIVACVFVNVLYDVRDGQWRD